MIYGVNTDGFGGWNCPEGVEYLEEGEETALGLAEESGFYAFLKIAGQLQIAGPYDTAEQAKNEAWV